MAQETLLITAGDVIDVQLTSETVVMEHAEIRHVEPGHITNRMRLFIRELDGLERKYDFDDTELGVRVTQRVAVVRGRVKRRRDPLNLLLFNLTSGEQDVFEDNLQVYLARKPLLGSAAKALVLAGLVALGAWLTQYWTDLGYEGALGVAMAGAFGVLAFPVFLWLCRIWDRVSEVLRYKRARTRFIADMSGRVRTYARGEVAAQPSTGAPLRSPPAAEPSGA